MKKKLILILTVMLMFLFISCTEETSTVLNTETTNSYIENNPVFFGVEDRVVLLMEEVDLLEGISVSDSQDGNLTQDIVILPNDFTSETIGVYIISIYVIDSDDNRIDASYEITVADHEFTDEEWVAYDLNKIDLSFPLNLPDSSNNGTYYTWISNNPRVITNLGNVINPHVGAEAVNVVLECTAVNGSFSTAEDFILTVNPNPEVEVTSQKTVEFTNTSDEYLVADKNDIQLFFVDEDSAPYIDIPTFLDMVYGAIDSTKITYSEVNGDDLLIEYSISYLDLDQITTVTEEYSAYFDFTENTFTVSNCGFYESYISETISDFGEGLLYVGAESNSGNSVTIPLGDYDFDILTYENNQEKYYLIPFSIANLLFLNDAYYDAYFNGDKIYGFDTFSISNDLIIDDIRESDFNGNNMPIDIRIDTYHFLSMILDYFYGLKNKLEIDSGYDILSLYIDDLLEGNNSSVYEIIFNFVYSLDDLHTSYAFPGYYEAPYYLNPSINNLGPDSYSYYTAINDMTTALNIKYGNLYFMPDYELFDSNTIAVVHLFELTIDTPNDFKSILDGLPSSVENVVIDLSYNSGGNLGAVLRIFGYITDETLAYHSINPFDDSAVTYYFESEYVAYNYNWYVLTSPVTFSAANLFASIAKENGIPIIGQKSSGGASSIGLVIAPDGSGIMISTDNVLSTKVYSSETNYFYESIEEGIDVDYYLNNVISNAELIVIINTINK